MKKYLFGLSVLLVVVLVASLYGYATAFNIRNVESFTIDGEIVSLEEEESSTFIRRMQSLKQYEVIGEHQGKILKQIVLNMKYGDSVSFELGLDYNFNTLSLRDINTDRIYLIDDELVEWIYMQPALEDIYYYAIAKRHQLTVNNQIIEQSSVEHHYTKANGVWYNESKEHGNITSLAIHEPILEFNVVGDGETELKVFREDELLYDGSVEAFEVPQVNGDYTVVVETTWKELLFYGSDTSTFNLSVQYPPEISMTKTFIRQGEFTIIRIKNVYDKELLYLEQDYMEGLEFTKNGAYYECVIPSTYYTTPGLYTFKYGVGEYGDEIELEVVDREFNLQFLTVSNSTVNSTQTDEAYEQYNAYYKPALEKDVYVTTGPYLDEGNFTLPATGRLTTEFGVQRYVNNQPTSYHHNGLDIANSEGTPIVATYDGEVVLSMELMVTGNTVVISHGNGLFSSYLHMSELSCEEGDVVKAGELIGKMGTTGFSTGSHLHFSISYHRMYMEPGYFLFGEPVTYDNYNQLIN